jgi:hypothetical protein
VCANANGMALPFISDVSINDAKDELAVRLRCVVF